MKGIILAGGSGTRLHPITKGISKQLLPVYDKPMIYYPISTLILAGIKEILIISTPDDLPGFKRLLGSGNELGLNFFYAEQPKPEGLAQAFIIGKDFIGKDPVCLVLGDNVFHGNGFNQLLLDARYNVEKYNNANIFGYYVSDPGRYGVAEFNKKNEVLSIVEKPKEPKSNYAVVGLYFYPNSVVKIATTIKPSTRGELEITSVNNVYLEKRKLKLHLMDRGYAWFDTGTHDSLAEAGDYIRTLEKRQGLKIGCIEENCLEQGFIDLPSVRSIGEKMKKTEYGRYLINRTNEWNQ